MQNQREKVLEILRQNKGKWVGLRVFFYAGITQPGSRSSELNAEGYEIENHCEWATINGNKIKKSWYFLKYDKDRNQSHEMPEFMEYVNTLDV